MVSKAMSGVKRPVLPDRERTSHRATKKKKRRMVERKTDRRREEGWVKRRVLIVKNYPSFLSFSPNINRHELDREREREWSSENI